MRIPNKIYRSIISALAVMLISGCATSGWLASPSNSANSLAAVNGFTKSFVKTSDFILTSYQRIGRSGSPVRFYIEGDGRAWISRTRLSDDPTPSDPLVIELAAMDPSPNVIYIARPGQYTESGIPDCDPAYWSSRRFSEEVIRSVNEAISQAVLRTEAKSVELVGYSGGAAVAVLVAARRNDIAGIRTIAGNLNPDELNRYHNVSSLEGSLDPMEVAEKIKDIPQRHFIGSRDKTVPPAIAESFVKKEGFADYGSITVVDGATHNDGWPERWKELLSLPY